MVKKMLFLLIVLLSGGLFAQEYDLLYTFNGKQAVLFLTVAPDFDQQVVVFRKTAGSEFVPLNKETPLRATEELSEIEALLGDDYLAVLDYTGAEDLDAVGKIIRGNGYQAALTTLLFPGAARAAGRLFIDSSAVQGTDYEYKAVYYNLLEQPVEEFTMAVKAVSVPPVSPSNLISKLSGAILSLEWEYPKWESDRNNLTIKYNVYRKSTKEGFTKVNETLLMRNDAVNGRYTELVKGDIKEAEYYVTAVDLAGVESKPSKSIKVRHVSDEQPSAPTGINSVVGMDRINLVWDVSSEPNVTGYNVYRKEKSKQDSVKLNKKPLPLNQPLYTDSLAKSAVIYYYYVTALTATGKESRLSSMAVGEILDTIPPVPPSGIKASILGDFVKLEWKASRSNDIKHYNIYRGDDKNILAKTGTTTTTTFVDSGFDGTNLVAGKVYYYAVSATDMVEIEGAQSDTIQFKYVDRIAPPAPVPFTAKNTTYNDIEIRIGMTMVADLAKVNIYRKTAGSAQKEQLIRTLNRLPSVFTDTTGKLNESYIYYAESIDSAGNKSPQSASNEVTVKDILLPAAVPQVNAVLRKDNKIEISWVAVFEKDLAGYNVYWSELPNGNYTLVNAKPVKETKLTDPNGKQENFYKVRAVDTSGNESEWSEAAPVIKPEVLEEEMPNNE